MKFSRSITLPLAGLAVLAALSGCGSNNNLTGLEPDTTPPPAPANLSLASDGSGNPLLTWDASAAPDVVGYQVQVFSVVAGAFVDAGDAVPADTNYPIPATSTGIQVTYRVRAVDGAGNWSSFSSQATVMVNGPNSGSGSHTSPDAPGAPIGID